ncbi:MAG: phosphatidate cytidylyltransferase [Bacillota bacterium]|nr:phosphatidate cytidylyltransferase [Bacillota bacterium]
MLNQANKRVITAMIGIPVLLLLLYFGGWPLTIAVMALIAVGCVEYERLVQRIGGDNLLIWRLLGFAYIMLGFFSFLGLRLAAEDWMAALWLLLIIWCTDIAAYEIGRRFGKHKLAPAVSPNKTVEGALAGAAGGTLAGGVFGVLTGAGWVAALLTALLISTLGQAGDLLESKVKRIARVKDSGSVFPGHGGILDRFDSILLSAPFMYLLSILLF